MLFILVANWKSSIDRPFKVIEYNYRVNNSPFYTSKYLNFVTICRALLVLVCIDFDHLLQIFEC